MDKIRFAKTAAAAAVTLLAGLEGYRSLPYLDIAGVLTDCYGETENVRPGVERGRLECLRLLDNKAYNIALFVLDNTRGDINVNQLVSFISLTYNIGKGGFLQSSTRREFNAGNHTEACNAMGLWNKVRIAGVLVPSPGLMNRRAQEIKVCLTPSSVTLSRVSSLSSLQGLRIRLFFTGTRPGKTSGYALMQLPYQTAMNDWEKQLTA